MHLVEVARTNHAHTHTHTHTYTLAHTHAHTHTYHSHFKSHGVSEIDFTIVFAEAVEGAREAEYDGHQLQGRRHGGDGDKQRHGDTEVVAPVISPAKQLCVDRSTCLHHLESARACFGWGRWDPARHADVGV